MQLTIITPKPCIRDYSVLITEIIPETFAQMVPLSELARRCDEVARTKPKYAEETPVLLAVETQRRQALAGPHLRRHGVRQFDTVCPLSTIA